MKTPPQSCFKCGDSDESDIVQLYGYAICTACKRQLGLSQDNTISKHIASFTKAQEHDPHKPSYEDEVHNRLILIEATYISARIKLLHIQERLKRLQE